MEIVNVTAKKSYVTPIMLEKGTLYQLTGRSMNKEILMVVENRAYTSLTKLERRSVSLDTGEIVPWEGHEHKECVILKGKLEVSEEV